jgi:polysaccharide pyruvyl transferase CsaB
MRQVFILGAYGQNNLGDEALLQVFIDQFSEAKLVVNSAQPEITSNQYNVQTVPTYLSAPRFRRVRAIWGADLIVFGGGSLLKEVEGNWFTRLMYFARIILVLLVARILGKTTAMIGVGMGPLHFPLYIWLTRICAAMTDLICVRDTDSANLLKSIGVTRHVHVTADAVFTLRQTEAPDAALARANVTPPPSPFVIVVPRYSMSAAQKTSMAAACDHLVENYGARIAFLPFQTNYLGKFDDAAATRDVQIAMRYADQSEIITTENVRAAYALIGKADLVLSMRLHALVFASAQGVASVALSYEVKVQSFMAELGQPWASLSLADLEAGKLPAILDRAWANRRVIGTEVIERVKTLQTQSQRNFDLVREYIAQQKKGGSNLLKGSALFMISATVVNLGNYVYNLIIGRALGPAAFADVNLMVTLMLLVTFVTTTLSLTTAKFSAMHSAGSDLARLSGLRRWLSHLAWIGGFALLAFFVLGSPLLSQIFQTASPIPFVILGLGLPFFVVQAIDRGVLQGQMRFGILAASFQAEMWVRLLGGLLLVALGLSVNGAVFALSLSFLATWLVASRARAGLPPKGDYSRENRREVANFSRSASAALFGQILINNSDILIVKFFFPPEIAGQYAALALIGRIVFFATWSVVTTMFPVVAQKHQRNEPHRQLLRLSLGLVAGVSGCIIAGTLLLPNLIVNILFGEAYLMIAPMLWLYAVATALYALANVVINYRLSIGNGSGSVVAALAGVMQVVGLLLFHNSLEQVVIVQVLIMAALFTLLMAWDWRLSLRERRAPAAVQVGV